MDDGTRGDGIHGYTIAMTGSTDGDPASGEEPLSADTVADYLRAHPDFLTHHPDVLHELEVRHESGGAVSLVERQVTSLRSENRRLKKRFRELVDHATSNQQLITRIHEIALALVEAAGPADVFEMLRDRVAREFRADRIRTMVFADAGVPEAKGLPEFAGDDEDTQRLVTPLIETGTPRVNGLSNAEIRALFGDTPCAGSCVLLPLSGKAWRGVLVIQSDDPARFDEGMGTEFLAYLADIVSLVVDPWVARA